MDTTRDDEISRSTLLAQLPPEIVASFTPEQRAALWELSHSPSWRRYPVNIRLRLPFFGRGFFVTVVAGPDRRSRERATRERAVNPLLTLPNILFMTSAAAFVATLAFLVLLLLPFLHRS